MNEKRYKQTTLSGLLWSFAERFGAQLVSTIVSIILARILWPKDYAVVALTNIFMAICNVFVVQGFGAALVQKKDSDDLDFSSAFYGALIISLFLYACLFFASPYIANWFEEPLLSPILRVVGLQLPISALSSVQGAYISKNFLFKKSFLASIIGTTISAVVGITIAYCGGGAWALVSQNMISLLIGRLVLFKTVKWRPKLMFSWKRCRTLLSFGGKLLGAGLLDVGYKEIRGVIIGKKYSAEDLAYYSKGQSLPTLISTNLNSPINSVLFPVMSVVKNDNARLKYMTKQSIRTSCYIISPILLGLAVISPVLVPVLFTEKWNDMIPYMQIMCFIYTLYPIHTANLQALKALGRSDLFLILEIFKKAIGILALIVSMWFGVLWIIVSEAISAILASFINAFPNKKLLNYSWFEQMKDILPYFGLAILMGAPVYAMNYLYLSLNWNMYLVLVMQVFVGAALYIGLSLIFRLEIFKYLLKTIKEFLHKGNVNKQANDKTILDKESE